MPPCLLKGNMLHYHFYKRREIKVSCKEKFNLLDVSKTHLKRCDVQECRNENEEDCGMVWKRGGLDRCQERKRKGCAPRFFLRVWAEVEGDE